MLDRIKPLCVKYRELIVYFIVGVITTLVNWIASFLLDSCVFDSSVALQNALINIIAWIVAVLVSFPLNRKWVFQSKNPSWLAEFAGFTTSRLSTLLIEELIMVLCVNGFHMPFMLSKVIDSVIVMVLNYVFSKLLVFRKGQQKK